MPIGTTAALIGGSIVGNVASAAIGADAAGKSAKGQAAAAKSANDSLKKIYKMDRERWQPYQQVGQRALSGLENPDFQRDFTAADFQADPGYAFRMAEGQKAMERSAAARGGLQSGGFAKALNRYSQGVASDEFQNAYGRFNQDRDRRFGRLSALAGMGQNANAAISHLGQTYGAQRSQNLLGAANAQGAANMAQANAWGGALSGIGKTGMDLYAMGQQQDWMNKLLAARGGGA